MGPKKEVLEVSRKKESNTMELKKEMIKKHEQGMRVAEIARFYNKPTSTICTILKKKDEIKDRYLAKGVLKISKQRPPVLEDTEKLLLVWINEKQSAGDTVTEKLIYEKAKMLYSDLCSKMPGPSIDNEEGFKASRGWFENFKRRSGIHDIFKQKHATSLNAKLAETFSNDFQNLITTEYYLPQQVFSCEIVSIFWKKMPKLLDDDSYEEKPIPGRETIKDRLTLLLCANASGDFKFKPHLLNNGDNPRTLDNTMDQNNQSNSASNGKAWMYILIVEWINEIFGPALKKYLTENNFPPSALIIMNYDNSHSPGLEYYLLDEFKFIKSIFFPPKLTPLIQPICQQTVSFKELYFKALFHQTVKVVESTNLTLADYWKNHFNMEDCLKNVDKAWSWITKRTLNSSWKKLWANCVEELDDDDHEQPVMSEIISMGKILGIEVNREEIQELMKEDSQELTTEELMDLHREQQNEIISPWEYSVDVPFADPGTPEGPVYDDATPPPSKKKKHASKQPLEEEVLSNINRCLKAIKQPDSFDTFGQHVASKLRELPKLQRIYLEQIISDGIYQAELGKLTTDSRITFNSKY